jgi:hypothetical protein
MRLTYAQTGIGQAEGGSTLGGQVEQVQLPVPGIRGTRGLLHARTGDDDACSEVTSSGHRPSPGQVDSPQWIHPDAGRASSTSEHPPAQMRDIVVDVAYVGNR